MKLRELIALLALAAILTVVHAQEQLFDENEFDLESALINYGNNILNICCSLYFYKII